MANGLTKHLRNFAGEVTRGLGIPRACARIIEVLAIKRRKLSFHELAESVKMSERSLRSHIRILVGKGILRREVAVTPRRRLSYEYYIVPLQELLAMVRNELAKRLSRLEKLSSEVRTGKKATA